MNLKECKVLSIFEFGSKYQKTDDEFSDSDLMQIVIQPLNDSIFVPLDKGVRHFKNEDGDDVRVYSLEKFLLLSLKGSYDGFISLTAMLNDKSDTKYIFKELLDDELFTDFVYSKLNYYINSIFGVTYALYKKLNHNPKGKDYFKFIVALNKLEHALELLDNKQAVSYKDFSFYRADSKVDVDAFKQFKRYHTDNEMQLLEEKYQTQFAEYYALFEELREKVNQFNKLPYEFTPLMNYDQLFKDRVTKELVKYYLEGE